MSYNFTKTCNKIINTVTAENIKLNEENNNSFSSDHGQALGAFIGGAASSIYNFIRYKTQLRKFVINATKQTRNILAQAQTLRNNRTNINARFKLQDSIEEIKEKVDQWLAWVEPFSKSILAKFTRNTNEAKQYKIKLTILKKDLEYAQNVATYGKTRSSTTTTTP